jgi:hypothetical protein
MPGRPDPRLRRQIGAAIFLKLLLLAVIWLAFFHGRTVVVGAEQASSLLGTGSHSKTDPEGR